MILQSLPDGTTNPQWVAARRGCLGASKIGDILRVGPRGGVSKMRQKYMMSLVAERLTGAAVNNINPDWPDIARGLEFEPVALAAYEAKRGVWLEPPAWIEHPTIEFAGATADGRCGSEGLVQVKCPRLENYLSIVKDGEIPADVIDQMRWELACSPSAQWNDYIAYNHDMPEGKRLWVKRLMRDNADIESLEDAARQFLQEVDELFTVVSETEFV